MTNPPTQWDAYVTHCRTHSLCEHSGLTITECKTTDLCDCHDHPEGDPA